LQPLIGDQRLGINKVKKPQTIVIDYANANVAKEMHVGHIRSIVIGDAIVRIFNFLGHHTIKQSHLGDWGTQFGMLIEYLFETGDHLNPYSVTDLDIVYKNSKKRFDSDSIFADKARARVVALQSGDETTIKIWKHLVKESLKYFQIIYDKLDVLLTEEDARGESFYNSMLADVITELEKLGLATLDDHAKVIFLDDFPIPYLIQKKDGGYLYATTDLAAAKFRIEKLGANRIIYLTDSRQKQHFAMLFATLNKAGWLKNNVRVEHIYFGTILGPDNKPFKTRSGESIRLLSLLEESESRAKQLAQEKNSNLTEQQLNEISHAIGIGSLKYADLRADKIKDYIFDWKKLLSFEGNTAPYLQNAYVRIRSVFRKGNIDINEIKHAHFFLVDDIEHQLALKVLEFPCLIHSIENDLSLHRMCEYLHDLAATYHRFYEHCPILSTEDLELRHSRLLLSDITARMLKLGLDLLGIKTLEQM
jgi:arginyl-tRNA synthetase